MQAVAGLTRRANQVRKSRTCFCLRRRKNAGKTAAPKTDFTSHFKCLAAGQAIMRKNFALRKPESMLHCRHPASPRGAFGQSSPDARRDAMDAGCALDERCNLADGEIVWS